MATAVPQPQVILCTGANRSLGFSILQVTALKLPSALYILGSRSVSAGEEAVQELRKVGVQAVIEVLQLDVTDDKSILAAVEGVRAKFGKLDVLINNAGIALIPSAPDFSDFRSSYNSTFNTNITSVALVTTAFLPLLHASLSPKVINVSSSRGSLERSTTGKLPATLVVAYSVSKTALNALTIELQKIEDGRDSKEGRICYYAACPGHLKTAFNGFRGKKDPLDGAEVVVRLVMGEGSYEGGTFWEFESGEMKIVPW